MDQFQTEFLHATILDESTVLVEAIDGVEINQDKSRHAMTLIAEKMRSDFGMIIHRKADYSITPVEVYDVLNSFASLKAIALVVARQRNFLPIETEKALFKGALEAFQSISEAKIWISSVLSESS